MGISSSALTVTFLFQTGSIKSDEMIANDARIESFYSKLVRLKALILNEFEVDEIVFLFQTGSIKRRMGGDMGN